MKLWDKGTEPSKIIERFTVGNDRELDMHLAKYDVQGTIAHVTMLESIGLLAKDELKTLLQQLNKMLEEIETGEFVIEEGIEDIHSQVELLLTREIGGTGKKIHAGRSRNDQILLDLRLFAREKIKNTASAIQNLFNILINLSESHKEVLMPGYTHMQIAMPSSFGLWFGAYAESLTDDMLLLHAAMKIVNQNPLGSAAGYGSSFPIDREKTTKLLNFENMVYNSLYASMCRGKTEKTAAYAVGAVAGTLNKLASDICLFMGQNYGFINFPDELTTGSSIMPHKKNPDVFELVRAKTSRLQIADSEFTAITNNLPSGYHRDFQLLKERFVNMFEEIIACIEITGFMLSKVEINKDILYDEKYNFLFSVEEVNKLVKQGVPFREAYCSVAKDIGEGTFKPSKALKHTHEGSIGNLCNEAVTEKMNQITKLFEL